MSFEALRKISPLEAWENVPNEDKENKANEAVTKNKIEEYHPRTNFEVIDERRLCFVYQYLKSIDRRFYVIFGF
jgi:hypothetical protein